MLSPSLAFSIYGYLKSFLFRKLKLSEGYTGTILQLFSKSKNYSKIKF